MTTHKNIKDSTATKSLIGMNLFRSYKVNVSII